MTKKAETKEVATKKENLPAEMLDMFLEDQGAGTENITKDDLAIPRLAILQSNSPKAEKRKEEYVEGAEPSMIIENVSNQLFNGEEGIVVVPIVFRRTVIEWKLRGSSGGGGFVADHGLNLSLFDSCKKDENGKMINDAGNQLVDTREYFVYLIDNGDWKPAVISMASTQAKNSKRWNTLIESVKLTSQGGKRISAASFYMSYKLTTVPESNDKGSWFGWDIKKNKATVELEYGKDIYLSAREFKKQVDSGEVKVADPDSDSSSEEIDSEDSAM